jgi:hypothetical protein
MQAAAGANFSTRHDHEPEMAPLNASLPKIVPREMELFVKVL